MCHMVPSCSNDLSSQNGSDVPNVPNRLYRVYTYTYVYTLFLGSIPARAPKNKKKVYLNGYIEDESYLPIFLEMEPTKGRWLDY